VALTDAGSTLKCKQNASARVILNYKQKPTTVSQGDVFVLPLNVKVLPNTDEGTCFFDIPVEITPEGGSTTTKHIELTVDVVP
jgi:hypothetical protein